MDLFVTQNYIDIVREKLKQNKAIRGFQSRMAQAMGVHGSYLSRALKGEVHLTPDQAALLAAFWNLGSLETEYFLALVNLARAGTPTLQHLLKDEISDIKRRHQDLTERFRDQKVTEATELYYSAWHYSAIHLLLTVPGHDTVKMIAGRLSLRPTLVEDCLKDLEKCGLAEKEGTRWKGLKNNLHLPNASLWANVHHSNWRQKAIFKLQERNEEGVRFTGIHAISEKDFERIKNLFLDAIERTRKLAGPSPEEDIFYVSVDAFRI